MTDSKQRKHNRLEVNCSPSIFLERLENRLQDPIHDSDSENIELLQEEVSISNEELAIAIEQLYEQQQELQIAYQEKA